MAHRPRSGHTRGAPTEAPPCRRPPPAVAGVLAAVQAVVDGAAGVLVHAVGDPLLRGRGHAWIFYNPVRGDADPVAVTRFAGVTEDAALTNAGWRLVMGSPR